MSAEAAPQPMPDELQSQQPDHQLVIDPQTRVVMHGEDIMPSPVTEAMNTAAAVESLYDTDNSDRLMSRSAVRLATVAERFSEGAQRAAQELADRRTASEVVDDLRDQGQEAYEHAVERGRDTAKQVGNSVSRAWKKADSWVGDRVDTAVEAGNNALDRFAQRAQEARARKEARQQQRQLEKQQRQEFLQRHKEQKQAERAERKEARTQRREARKDKRLERQIKVSDFIDDKIETTKAKKEHYKKVGKAALKTGALVTLGAADAAGRKTAEFTREKAKLVERDVKRAREAASEQYHQTKENVVNSAKEKKEKVTKEVNRRRATGYNRRAVSYQRRSARYHDRAAQHATRARELEGAAK